MQKIKCGKICTAIAKREKCTNAEALELIRDDLNEAMDLIEEGNFQMTEDLLISALRIEPDLIEDFMFQFI